MAPTIVIEIANEAKVETTTENVIENHAIVIGEFWMKPFGSPFWKLGSGLTVGFTKHSIWYEYSTICSLISDLIGTDPVAGVTKDVLVSINREADHPDIVVIRRRNQRNRNDPSRIAIKFHLLPTLWIVTCDCDSSSVSRHFNYFYQCKVSKYFFLEYNSNFWWKLVIFMYLPYRVL